MIIKNIFYDTNDDEVNDFCDSMFNQCNIFCSAIIAGNGYSYNQKQLDRMIDSKHERLLVTNDINVWNDERIRWDDEHNCSQSYILFEDGSIRNIQELTQKDIRKAHNIAAIYKAGGFQC